MPSFQPDPDLAAMIAAFAQTTYTAKKPMQFLVDQATELYGRRVAQATEKCVDITDREAIDLARNNLIDGKKFLSEYMWQDVIIQWNSVKHAEERTQREIAEAIARTESKNFADYKQSIHKITEVHSQTMERTVDKAMERVQAIVQDMTVKFLEHSKDKDKDGK